MEMGGRRIQFFSRRKKGIQQTIIPDVQVWIYYSLSVLVLVAMIVNIHFFSTLSPGNHHGRRGFTTATGPPMTIDTTIITKNDQLQDTQQQEQQQQQKLQQSPMPFSSHRVLETFRDAGITLTDEELASLPTWEDIEQVVGTKGPVLYNLESCSRYRSLIPPVERNIGCSGMFNSGTNLLTQLLKANCVIPERVEKYGNTGPYYDSQGKAIGPGEAHGIRWQVPWGKHMPAIYREEHSTKWAAHIWKESVFAVVTIRHPFAWFRSMCHNHYSAYWPHNERRLCPHLVDTKTMDVSADDEEDSRHHSATTNNDKNNSKYHPNRALVPVHVKYDRHETPYKSLAHLWNDWYAQYLRNSTFPYVMVRFEDLQFHAENVTHQVCTCAGGTIRTDRPFSYIVQSAKDGPGHGRKEERTGMLEAWKKYGKPMPPQNGFSREDFEAAKEYLDAELLQLFGYNIPDPLPP
jgi:hypothetical protein